MSTHLKPRLTFANVMSIVAVFIALGGSAYAAQLAKNSVGTKQLKKNAVTAAKIKAGAVNSSKLKDGAVSGADLAAASVDGGKLAVGAVGSAALASGSVIGGKLGIINTRVVSTPLPDNGVLTRSVAPCAAGETLIGGGVNTLPFGKDIVIQGSRPSLPNAGEIADGEGFTNWQTSAINEPGETGIASIRSWAVCLR